MLKNLLTNTGDTEDVSLIPGLERSPVGGNDNPLQYSRLENFMDRGAWWATDHGIAKELYMTERLSACVHTHTHTVKTSPHLCQGQQVLSTGIC